MGKISNYKTMEKAQQNANSTYNLLDLLDIEYEYTFVYIGWQCSFLLWLCWNDGNQCNISACCKQIDSSFSWMHPTDLVLTAVTLTIGICDLGNRPGSLKRRMHSIEKPCVEYLKWFIDKLHTNVHSKSYVCKLIGFEDNLCLCSAFKCVHFCTYCCWKFHSKLLVISHWNSWLFDNSWLLNVAA